MVSVVGIAICCCPVPHAREFQSVSSRWSRCLIGDQFTRIPESGGGSYFWSPFSTAVSPFLAAYFLNLGNSKLCLMIQKMSLRMLEKKLE